MSKKQEWNGNCICGHSHSDHGPSGSINYSAGRCSRCNCLHFIHNRESSTSAPEPEIDLIGNDPLSWALQELMGLGDKFGRQIYTVSRLFADIRTKRNRSGGVCVCDRADQPKPDTDVFSREEVKLILSQRESYFMNHSPDDTFLATGQWLDKHYIPGLHLLPSPSSTPTASGTEGEEKERTEEEGGFQRDV